MATRIPITRMARQLTSSKRFCAPRRTAAAGLARFRWGQLEQSRLFSLTTAGREKLYTEEHEWIEVSQGGKECTLGISKYAADALGDVVYIELPELDLEVDPGNAIGAVESVKSASDIMTPVAGTVKHTNKLLEEKPKTINEDPEGHGWIVKLELKEGAVENAGMKLMSESEYTEYTEELKAEHD